MGRKRLYGKMLRWCDFPSYKHLKPDLSHPSMMTLRALYLLILYQLVIYWIHLIGICFNLIVLIINLIFVSISMNQKRKKKYFKKYVFQITFYQENWNGCRAILSTGDFYSGLVRKLDHESEVVLGQSMVSRHLQ